MIIVWIVILNIDLYICDRRTSVQWGV